MDSREALDNRSIPHSIIGAGVIGMEFAFYTPSLDAGSMIEHMDHMLGTTDARQQL